MLSGNKVKSKNCVVGLPVNSIFTKRLNLPLGLSDEEVEHMLDTELAGFVPFDLQDAALDWVVLDQGQSLNDDMVDYLVTATKQEKVDERVAIVEQVGLSLVGVDGDVFAISSVIGQLSRFKSLIGSGRAKVDLVVDIGHRRSRVYVYVDDVYVYEREIQQGCQALTVLVSQELGCSIAEAEKIKRRQEKGLDRVFEYFNSQMLQEVSRAIQLFYTSTQYNWIDTLWLAGRGGSTYGLADFLKTRGGFNVLNVDVAPLVSSSVSMNMKDQMSSSSMFLAYGLAFNYFLVQK
jgi:type IV pilus assembly protein PilM